LEKKQPELTVDLGRMTGYSEVILGGCRASRLGNHQDAKRAEAGHYEETPLGFQNEEGEIRGDVRM